MTDSEFRKAIEKYGLRVMPAWDIGYGKCWDVWAERDDLNPFRESRARTVVSAVSKWVRLYGAKGRR